MGSKLLDFSAYIESRTRNFVRREWVFTEIDVWLEDPNGPRYFILSGEPGSGKSAVMARYSQIRELDGVHFCIADQADSIDPIAFARSISHQLCGVDGFAVALLEDQGVHVDVKINVRKNFGTIIGVKVDNILINPPSPQVAFNQAVLMPLKALYNAGYKDDVVVLVDGLDESEQFGGGAPIYELLAALGSLDPKVRFVISARTNSKAETRFQDLPAKRLELGATGGSNMEDLRAFIRHMAEKSDTIQNRLQDSGLSLASFIAMLEDKHQGNFHYLVQLFAGLQAGAQWVDDLSRLPAGLDGIYREHLRTRAVGKDISLWRSYRPVLGVLAAAAEPLTLEQAASFSGITDLQSVDDVFQDAGQFLDHTRDEPKRSRIFHQSLADFLKDRQRSGDYWINLPAVHGNIAAVYQGFIESHAWSGCDDYGIQHLAQHLASAVRTNDLIRLLQDTTWMSERLRRSSVQALIGDYQLGLVLLGENTPPVLRKLRDFFKLTANILASDPTQLPGQLIGRLGSSDDLEVQHLLDQVWKYTDIPWLCPVRSSFLPPGKSLLRTLTGHGDKINAVMLTGDGKIGISVSADGMLKIWDIENEVERSSHSLGSDATSLALLPGGEYFLCGTRDGRLIKMSLVTGTPVRTWTENMPGWIRGLAVTPDGELALVGVDTTMGLFRLEDGSLVAKMSSSASGTGMLSISPDGQMALAGGVYDYLSIWEISSGRSTGSLPQGTDSWVSALAVTPDWKLAASGDWEGRVIFWDLPNKRRLSSFVADSYKRVSAVALTPDANFAVVTIDGSGMYILNLGELFTSGDVSRTNYIDLINHRVNSIAITPDGRRAITAGTDFTLRFWSLVASDQNIPSVSMVRGVADLPPQLPDASITPDETPFTVTTNGRDDDDHRYRDATRATIRRNDNPEWKVEVEQGWFSKAAVSIDGKRAAFVRNRLQAWDLELRGLIGDYNFPEGQYNPSWLMLSSEGSHAAVLFSSQRLFRVELKTGAWIQVAEGVEGVPCAKKDGEWLAAALKDNTLRFWDVANGNELGKIEMSAGIRQWWMVESGDRVVTVGKDGDLGVWDVAILPEAGLTRLVSLDAHPLGRVEIFNRQYAVSLSIEGEAAIWDILQGFKPDGKTEAGVKVIDLYRFKARQANEFRLVWSGNGRMVLVTAGEVLETWNPMTGRRLAGIQADRRFVKLAAGFSATPDEKLWIWAWDEQNARHGFWLEIPS